jgi:hypothetical protein
VVSRPDWLAFAVIAPVELTVSCCASSRTRIVPDTRINPFPYRDRAAF